MAKDKLTEYSATNESNDVIGDISVAEGMLPSAVNNALREQMTHLKNFSDGTDAIDALAVDNLKLDGNTISSTDTNGNINLAPDGTGVVALSSTDLTFGDNDKAIFGAGSDLQVFHDGTHSYIKDAGTGSLRLLAENFALMNADATESMILAVPDAAVTLFYNGNTKLQTTSGGIDVTGTVTADGLTVDGNAQFNTGGTGIAEFYHSSGQGGVRITGGADSSDANLIFSNGKTTTPTDVATLAVDGANDSFYIFRGGVDGSGTKSFRIASNGDVSLYADDGTTQGLFWDASTQRLGLGTTSPTSPLHVETTSQRVGTFISTGADPQVYIGDAASSDNAFVLGYDRADNRGYLTVAGDSDSVFTIANGGNVGIGTTSPVQKLDVYGGNIAVSSADTYQTAVNIDNTDTGGRHFGLHSTGSNNVAGAFRIYDYDANSERMRINSSGDVGINSSSPSSKLYAQETSTRTVSTTFGARAGQVFRNENAELAFGLDSASPYLLYMQGRYSNNTARGLCINPLGGDVGIGTSSPSSYASTTLEISGSSTTSDLKMTNTTTGTGDGSGFDLELNGSDINYVNRTASGNQKFWTNSAERMRITAGGSLLLGTADEIIWNDASGEGVVIYQGKAFQVARNNDSCVQLNRQGSDGAIQLFARGGTQVGRIDVTASSTSYVTSSDYRLKENVTYDWDATTRLKQLKPARFNFIADPDTTVDGFLAHECSAVPEAISGEKDAMRDEEYEVTPAVLDDDGNVVTEAVMGTRSVPDYQGIDQSKLVPLLVKTIQELEARITALETN